MANRLMKVEGTVAQNVTDEKIGEIEPPSGQSYEVLELWTDGNADVEISATVDERQIIDHIPASDLATVDQRLVYDLRIDAGTPFAVLANETAGAEQTVSVYLLVDER